MKLVKVADFNIKSFNYYWERKTLFNLSEDELQSVGVAGNYALIDEVLIPPLQKANQLFKKHGYEIIVKDGYRSPELYKLVQEKRYKIDGKANTDRTLNVDRMPHATGRVVDINLVSLDTGLEVETWDRKDWPDAAFKDFYRNKKDLRSKEFQRLQTLMISTMLSVGFKLGPREEFWHFEYNIGLLTSGGL